MRVLNGLSNTPCGSRSAWMSYDSSLAIVSSTPWPTLASHSRKPLQFNDLTI